MNTVDSLLTPVFHEIKQIQTSIPQKDRKILLSLYKQVSSGVFLTENQGKLLVKILNENLPVVSTVVPEVQTTLECNTWSKSFREVKRVRKIYISADNPEYFVVEFNYSPQLRDKITQIVGKISGPIQTSGTKYIINLTETNISAVIDTFSKQHFDIDEKLLNFYQEIQEILKNSSSYDNILLTKNEKLKKSVIEDIGIIAPENALLLHDRKIRYQYKFFEEIDKNSLCAKIATRADRRIFIDSEKYSMSELVAALKELNRLPMLTIFDGHSSNKDKNYLKILEKSVGANTLGHDVGIYFRYNKDVDTENFNQEVGSLGYNKNLKSSTIVAGISSTKLPKFMIKDGWKPKTVVSFTNSFRTNKTYVYFSDVDLIVYYGTAKPIGQEVILID